MRHNVALILTATLSGAIAGPALAQSPGDFIIGRDVPVRNAFLPGEPGRAVTVQMAPDMSIMSDIFGGKGKVSPLTDEAAALVTSSVTQGTQALSAEELAAEASPLNGDLYAFGGGGSMEARGGGLGGSIAGAVLSGLQPMMGLTRALGGGR